MYEVIVERNHVNQKKARFLRPVFGAFFYEAAMKFYRLSSEFYKVYNQYDEILTKEDRPYYILLIELNNLTFAIPLRSNITHQYCFIADKTNNKRSGLDYSKALVFTEPSLYIDLTPVTIRQHEFNILKKNEYLIKTQFSSYVKNYKKEVIRRIKNKELPASSLYIYSSLKYFHNELGLDV